MLRLWCGVRARRPLLHSPGYALERTWVRALIEDDALALVAVSEGLAEIGYALYACEALIDAALVEARRSVAGPLALRAAAAVEALDYRPMLGPLPEKRWVHAGAVSAS